MFLRTSTQKRRDGSTLTHFQIAESTWDPARRRSRTKLIYNCGRAENPDTVDRLRRLAKSILRRCSPEELLAEREDWRVVDAWPHGQIHVLEALWKRLGIPRVLEKVLGKRRFQFEVERALFVLVANRACAPCSKLWCFEQWMREEVRIRGTEELELHHLYRAMDVLEEHQEEIERELYFSVSTLLNLDVELIFYDTTSLHFEVDEPDEDVVVESDAVSASDRPEGPTSESTETVPGLRKRGHSKNGRSDAPQIVVGMAVTRDGFPVRHWVFPGNTVDVTTVAKVKQDLAGWKLSRCVFVGDAGMVSQANLQALARAGGRYIVAMSLGREKEVANEVLGRPGRYKKVAENLRVKEVTVGDGERRRRYVVCHNPSEEERQRKHRERVLAELEAELACLKDLGGERHTRRMCQLRASRRFGRYLSERRGGGLRVDRAKVQAVARRDGKFVVHSNDDSLSAEDMALGYKQLLRVEKAWRDMKSGLGMRPVFHWVPRRIHAHIHLTVLALLLQRTAEHATQATWRTLLADLSGIKLAQLSTPDGTLWQTTEPRPEARKHLQMLEIPAPPLVLKLA